jgi:uncharacterized protein (DUF427 family)
MRAMLGNTVLAEASKDDLVMIEGNWYFPPASVTDGVLTESPTAYTCPWKGPAQYFSVAADGESFTDRAWSYPDIKASAVTRVGRDFAGFVAFAPDVRVVEQD